MFAVGVALIAGIGMRIAAGAGLLVLVMMWFAEFPLAHRTRHCRRSFLRGATA